MERLTVMDTSAPRFMGVADFIKRYGFRRAHAYHLIEDGSLPAVRIGKKILVDITAAEAWIASLPSAAKLAA